MAATGLQMAQGIAFLEDVQVDGTEVLGIKGERISGWTFTTRKPAYNHKEYPMYK